MSTNGKNGSNGSHANNVWAGSGRRGDGKIRVAIVGVAESDLGAVAQGMSDEHFDRVMKLLGETLWN